MKLPGFPVFNTRNAALVSVARPDSRLLVGQQQPVSALHVPFGQLSFYVGVRYRTKAQWMGRTPSGSLVLPRDTRRAKIVVAEVRGWRTMLRATHMPQLLPKRRLARLSRMLRRQAITQACDPSTLSISTLMLLPRMNSAGFVSCKPAAKEIPLPLYSAGKARGGHCNSISVAISSVARLTFLRVAQSFYDGSSLSRMPPARWHGKARVNDDLCALASPLLRDEPRAPLVRSLH